jgi:superfamily II DNA helicase RecQ
MLTFSSLLATPEGQRLKTLFLDEAQELYIGHKDRLPVYRQLFRFLTSQGIQIVCVSGTLPPHLHSLFCEKATLDPTVRVIRAPTDRPELGYDILDVNPSKSKVTAWESTVRLVSHLKPRLLSDERMIVFFMSTADAERFSKETKCAIYHSTLPKTGHGSKEYHLDRWDRGKSPVLAATTACGQGIDRPFIPFVVFHLGAFGLISFDQGGGRAGRRQRPSFVIVVHDSSKTSASTAPLNSLEDPSCNVAFNQYLGSAKRCLRRLIRNTMDGEQLAVACKDSPGCNPCSVCHPKGEMYAFFRHAITQPLPIKAVTAPPPYPVLKALPAARAWPEEESDEDLYGAPEFTTEMAKAMDEAEVGYFFFKFSINA